MATDVEKLVVSLEASITKYERTMSKALGVTNNTMKRIEKRQQVAMGRTEAGWSAMSRGIASAFAGVAALRGAQQLIDASTRIENSLKVAGLAGEQLNAVYDSLFQSAQRNAAPLESLVTLYGRVALVQKELGASTKEMLQFTDNVALALRVAGTDAQSASGALLQLSQAMGSGVVRAEEFNSILEGALPIAQAVAAGLQEAGGSVAKLRQLVVDGKVSSEAFFRAFEAGSVILKEKVANAELTVSQQFVRLQNVLVDVAGKFNEATGASSRTGRALSTLATFIENVGSAISANKENISWFIDKIGEGAALLPALGPALKALENFNLSMDVELQTEAAKQEAERFAAETEEMFRVAIGSSIELVDEWRSSWGETLPPELQASVDALLEKIKAGGEEAGKAQTALSELGSTDTPFNEALGHLNTLVAELQRVRGEANATAAAVAQAARPNVAGLPMSYAGQDGAGPQKPPSAVKPITLDDPRYRIPPTGSGKGGGGKAGADRFADAVAAQERRIAALQRETALQSTLNPLVKDYGFAIERLRAQMELENAAAEAGLELTPQRRAQIEELATAYATATANAASLEEQQQKLIDGLQSITDIAGEVGSSLREALSDGKLEGQELLGIVLQIGKALWGLSGLGSNPIGALVGGLLGFASGTANTGGRRGEPRGIVHGQEAVIPLPSGGKVPVVVKQPAAHQAAPQQLTVHVVADDEKFSAYVMDGAGKVVRGSAPAIIKTSVSASPAATVEKQMRYGM